MRRRALFVGCLLGLVLAAGLVPLAGCRAGSSAESWTDPEENPYEGLEIPAFSLVDSADRPVTEKLLEGRVSVVDFFFTRCPLVCPGMNLAMRRLEGRLARSRVQFVSISVDPAHDTPGQLRRYAAGLGADPRRWTFLTGSPETVTRIVRDGLRFGLSTDPATPIRLEDGSTMPNILHPARLFLIGPDRRVLGMYAYTDAGEMDALAERARGLARQEGR